MSERMSELLWQAGGYTKLDGSYSLHESHLQKFAELIVGECIDIGDNYQDILGNEPECFNCRKVAYGIVDKIKQHFGVEK
jgi:hypothetical protein